jgi:hypothetical protein
MAQRTIRPALMATAAAGLLALGSPLAHSAGGGGGGGGGVGLPFSVGSETTKAAGWVPFPGATQRNTAAAEVQRCQEQARGAGDQNACSPDKSDKKADNRK